MAAKRVSPSATSSAARGIPFVILDASERTGDSWRNRWDSLRVFSPARLSGLPGLKVPQPPRAFPTKDEIADYLEAYARHFKLPIRHERARQEA